MERLKSKKIIEEYYGYKHKKIYEEILQEYKIRYIYNESKVEGNISPEEQLGISCVYDYISDFNFDKDYFNIFVTSLLIHQKLYSKCPGEGFGGSLRDATAVLKGTTIDVMSPEEAKAYFNSFIQTSDDIFLPLKEGNILKYIELCVYTTTELIKAQPFADGNKRTFRSLLNLLLKKISLPPVYISLEYRGTYKEVLLRAMQYGEYEPLYNFYYGLIDKSIKELALENNEYEHTKEKVKRLIEDIRKA